GGRGRGPPAKTPTAPAATHTRRARRPRCERGSGRRATEKLREFVEGSLTFHVCVPTTTWSMPPGSGDTFPEDYERGRPGWPREVVELLDLPPTATVLDLGAGTGKLTRLLP